MLWHNWYSYRNRKILTAIVIQIARQVANMWLYFIPYFVFYCVCYYVFYYNRDVIFEWRSGHAPRTLEQFNDLYSFESLWPFRSAAKEVTHFTRCRDYAVSAVAHLPTLPRSSVHIPARYLATSFLEDYSKHSRTATEILRTPPNHLLIQTL